MEATLSDHHAFVRARLRGLGVPVSDLDDATQDVFMVLARRIADYDHSRPMRHWLAGMARRIARRYRERVRKNVIAFDAARVRGPADTEDAVRRAEAGALLDAFLQRLDADRWAVFVLAEVEGLRGTEIAAELGENLDTVYARLRSARTEFERTLRRHHARERRGLAAILPLGGLGSAGESARWTPVVALASIVAIASGLVLARSCAHANEDADAAASAPAVAHADAPDAAAGVQPRATDPAAPPDVPKAIAPKTPDGAGWFSASSGMSERDGRTVSHEGRYRLTGDRIVYETTTIGDDDEAAEVAGHFVVDGLEIIDGAAEFAVTLAAQDTLVQTTTLRATRDGCVRLSAHRGPRPVAGVPSTGSSSRHVFVFEDGALRHVENDAECSPRAESSEEALSGVAIDVDVYNDCNVPVEFIVFAAPEGKRPPPTLRKHTLAAGEHRRMRIDSAQWFRRPNSGGGARLDHDGEVHFNGESCELMRTQDRPNPAP